MPRCEQFALEFGYLMDGLVFAEQVCDVRTRMVSMDWRELTALRTRLGAEDNLKFNKLGVDLGLARI